MPVTRRHMLNAALLVPLLRLPAWAAGAVGRVVDIVNSATSRAPATAPQPLARDSAIGSGETVHTDDHSAVQVALDDGSVVTIGAGSDATFTSGDAALLAALGSLRFSTGAGAAAPPQIATPALTVSLHQAEMILTVGANGATACGVYRGRIVCTSIKKGTTAEVAAGQSVRWSDGAFGAGVMDVAYLSGDTAVDDGMAAARAVWEEPPPMSKHR